jgi:hypothetical protein
MMLFIFNSWTNAPLFQKGDFTFPAGRTHVNPRLEQPYFCRPINALRGYDMQACEPESAFGNRAAPATKFFIWASAIKHGRSSLDYFSEWVRDKLENPEEWARDIIDQSFVVDRTLYFKTHCHSMFPYYREGKRRPVYPHAHAGIQTLFSMVFDSAVRADVEIEFATASEVYERFVTADHVPTGGFGLTIPSAPTKTSHADEAPDINTRDDNLIASAAPHPVAELSAGAAADALISRDPPAPPLPPETRCHARYGRLQPSTSFRVRRFAWQPRQ